MQFSYYKHYLQTMKKSKIIIFECMVIKYIITPFANQHIKTDIKREVNRKLQIEVNI